MISTGTGLTDGIIEGDFVGVDELKIRVIVGLIEVNGSGLGEEVIADVGSAVGDDVGLVVGVALS